MFPNHTTTPSLARNAPPPPPLAARNTRRRGCFLCRHPPPPSLARNVRRRGFLCRRITTNPSLAQIARRRGYLSPTPPACHQSPPSLETRAEGVSFVTHIFCLPPTPSVARNASGGVYPYFLPATNLLRRSKCGRRGFFLSPTSSACHQPPPSLETRAEGSFFITHTLCLPPISTVA